jgi:hypothetical protein
MENAIKHGALIVDLKNYFQKKMKIIIFLADDELGMAPIDPGTYEGGHGKPENKNERLNKWCARECERSIIVEVNQPLELKNYSKRVYNKG